jgi:hypothetical protein
LAWGINKLLPDIIRKTKDGNKVAYAVAKAHCALNTALSLLDSGEGMSAKKFLAAR